MTAKKPRGAARLRWLDEYQTGPIGYDTCQLIFSVECNCSTVRMPAAFILIDDRVGVSDSYANYKNIWSYGGNLFTIKILILVTCISLLYILYTLNWITAATGSFSPRPCGTWCAQRQLQRVRHQRTSSAPDTMTHKCCTSILKEKNGSFMAVLCKCRARMSPHCVVLRFKSHYSERHEYMGSWEERSCRSLLHMVHRPSSLISDVHL